MNLEEAFKKKISHVPITVMGKVIKILEDDKGETPHQRFIVEVHPDHTVLVAHNLERAYRVDVKESDLVEVHGEYVWNKYGGIIHNTHHSLKGEHEDGWINFVGKKRPDFQ